MIHCPIFLHKQHDHAFALPPDMNLNQRSQVCAIRIKVYITTLPSERLDTMAFHLAKRMFFEACGYDAFSNLPELCCCGRPDWIDVLSEASKQNDAKHKSSKGKHAVLTRATTGSA
jgi:hypothetical protein